MNDYRSKIKRYLEIEKSIIENLSLDDINDVMNVLEEVRLSNHRIYVFGNGGSGATASHMVCDFNKGISLNQEQKYDFCCLNDNMPQMMAIANDLSYDDIFVEPLKGRLRKGDAVVGISGSGNSENVIRALKYARECGAWTIALTGYSGGRCKQIAEHNIHVPIDNMQITEDIHMVMDHLMMYILSGELD